MGDEAWGEEQERDVTPLHQVSLRDVGGGAHVDNVDWLIIVVQVRILKFPSTHQLRVVDYIAVSQ